MRYRVKADVFFSRQPDANSALILKKGQLVPPELLRCYSEAQILSHVKSGKIEEDKEIAGQNKIAPKMEKKGAH